MLTTETLNDVTGIRHGFFTRKGGCSQGIYRGLNCGYGSDDETDAVRQNRTRAVEKLGMEGVVLNTVHQIHSPNVVEVKEPWEADQAPKADGMVSRHEGIALGILTADCAPVLFADANARVIGAAHAGWRGAKEGVLGATVGAMVDLGADVNRIQAAIGPCIQQRSYEVGPEFHRGFVDEDSKSAEFFVASTQAEHFMFDLAGYVERQLLALSLEQVDVVDVDTYTDEDRFFSSRRATHRGESDYGRGLSAILLTG
ncbi:MAG: peptidoglycan editing factor PgeF [Rhodospirillaceae bacterium]|nr:peptidoglycan editing factor PgeF [Rhodospirillaceae bacterium]